MSSNDDTIIADVAGYSHDDLVDLYEKLAARYRRTKQENETFQQETFHVKQQNRILTAGQDELQNELETININHQRELEEANKKHCNTIQNLKKKNHLLEEEKIQQDTRLEELTR